MGQHYLWVIRSGFFGTERFGAPSSIVLLSRAWDTACRSQQNCSHVNLSELQLNTSCQCIYFTVDVDGRSTIQYCGWNSGKVDAMVTIFLVFSRWKLAQSSITVILHESISQYHISVIYAIIVLIFIKHFFLFLLGWTPEL